MYGNEQTSVGSSEWSSLLTFALPGGGARLAKFAKIKMKKKKRPSGYDPFTVTKVSAIG